MTRTIYFTLALLMFSLLFASCDEEEDQPEVTPEPTVHIHDTPASVGDYRNGGIAFWVNSSDSTKGLVVAISDLLQSAQWGCYGEKVNGANNTNLTGGALNTKEILHKCKSLNIAADLCDEAFDHGYKDWYLANTGEWAELLTNLDMVETAAVAHGGRKFYDKYWTSNQPSGKVGETLALALDIRNNRLTQERKDGRFSVRAIRAF